MSEIDFSEEELEVIQEALENIIFEVGELGEEDALITAFEKVNQFFKEKGGRKDD